MSALHLPGLGIELWGEAVGRARTRSGISQAEAANRIERVTGIQVSRMTLSRIEDYAEPPDAGTRKGRLHRRVCYFALVVYGYEPEEFGLDIGDLPSGITKKQLADLRKPLLDWVTDSPSVDVQAA